MHPHGRMPPPLREATRGGGGRLAWALLATVALMGSAHAGEPELAASMDCRTEPGSGRLLCTLMLVPDAAHSLSWSDALVVAAPPAAQPLRARVSSASAEPARIVIGFVLGSGPGGPIEVLARAVSCPKPGRAGVCRPASARVVFPWAQARG
jgi:hypothetical protein